MHKNKRWLINMLTNNGCNYFNLIHDHVHQHVLNHNEYINDIKSSWQKLVKELVDKAWQEDVIIGANGHTAPAESKQYSIFPKLLNLVLRRKKNVKKEYSKVG